MPLTTPALTVADNQDGTVTAIVTGADSLSTNTILAQAFNPSGPLQGWTTQGQITGNGSLTFSLNPGSYWGQCSSAESGQNVLAPIVYFTATNGVQNGQHEQCLQAVILRLQALTLTGAPGSADQAPPSGVFDRLIPVDQGQPFPYLMVSIEGVAPKIEGGTNARDDWAYPVQVRIVDALQGDYQQQRSKYSKWLEQIGLAFISQRLAGVPGVQKCVVAPGTAADARLQAANLFAAGLTLWFTIRRARGLTT